MILVIAGTQDGREIAELLAKRGHAVTASVVSDYGRSLFKNSSIKVNNQPLKKDALIEYIHINDIKMLIDATHPYAAHISATAINVAKELGLSYLRYERAESPLPDYEHLYIVPDYETAAAKAAELGHNIFLTTGSRQLKLLCQQPAVQNCTLTARVLPEESVIRECGELGFSPANLIAIQGPFSHELNKELFLKYKADVIISKNSGQIGGTDTKLTAAMELGLSVVIIDRPRLDYPLLADNYDAVADFAAQYEK